MALKDLYNGYYKAVHDARAILDRADRERRDLTADESAQYDRIDAEIERLGREIERDSKPRPAAPARPAAPVENGKALEVVYPGVRLGHAAGRPERRTAVRPGSPEALRHSDAYRKAYLNYLQTGRQQLGLQVSKDPKGGYLAPTQFVADLIKFLDDAVVMRQVANVLPPLGDAVSLGVPTWDTDPNDADWTAEVPASDISEDTAAAIGKREFRPHLVTKLVKVSMKLLRSSVLSVESLITERVGYKMALTEEKAFLTGDGAQQPLGVFTASSDGLPTSRDTTCTGQTAFTADEVIDVFYSLKEQYQRNASWLVSREFVKRLRKLKDGQGQYLWQPGLAGQPGTILDRPYLQSEHVPSTYTTGLYVAAVGDFRAGYWIADSLQMEVQRLDQLFALRNQIGILVRKETDGAPVLPEAMSRLKLG